MVSAQGKNKGNNILPVEQTIYLEKQKLASATEKQKPSQRNQLAWLLLEQDKLAEARVFLLTNKPCFIGCSADQILSNVLLSYIDFKNGVQGFTPTFIDSVNHYLDSSNNQKVKTRIEFLVGKFYLHNGEYSKAFESFLEAKLISQKASDSSEMVEGILGIAEVFLRTNNYDSSLFYLNQLTQFTAQLSPFASIRLNNLLAEIYLKKKQYDYARLYVSKSVSEINRASYLSWMYGPLLNRLDLNQRENDLVASRKNLSFLQGVSDANQNAVLANRVVLRKAEYLLNTGDFDHGVLLLDSLLENEFAFLPQHEIRKVVLLLVNLYYKRGEYKKAFDLDKQYKELILRTNDYTASRFFEKEATGIRLRVSNKVYPQASSKFRAKPLTPTIINTLLVLGLMVIGILIFKNFQTSREDIESLEHKNKALFNLNKELRKINEALDDSKQLLSQDFVAAKKDFTSLRNQIINQLQNNNLALKALRDTALIEDQLLILDGIKNGNEKIEVTLDGFEDRVVDNRSTATLSNSTIQLETMLEELRALFNYEGSAIVKPITTKVLSPMEDKFKGDSLRIRQVLINLIQDMIDRTKDGEISIEVQRDGLLRAKTDDARLARISFSVVSAKLKYDNDKLEGMIQNVSNAEGEEMGRISKTQEMVVAMGGKLRTVTNLEGKKGFVFQILVEIPSRLIDDKGLIHGVNEGMAFPNSMFSERFPMQILVAEKNTFDRLNLAKSLQKLGYIDAKYVESRADLITTLENTKVNLLLVDKHFLDFNSESEISLFKELIIKSSTAVIVMHQDELNREEEAIRSLIDDILLKPIKMNNTESILEKYGLTLQGKV